MLEIIESVLSQPPAHRSARTVVGAPVQIFAHALRVGPVWTAQSRCVLLHVARALSVSHLTSATASLGTLGSIAKRRSVNKTASMEEHALHLTHVAVHRAGLTRTVQLLCVITLVPMAETVQLPVNVPVLLSGPAPTVAPLSACRPAPPATAWRPTLVPVLHNIQALIAQCPCALRDTFRQMARSHTASCSLQLCALLQLTKIVICRAGATPRTNLSVTN